MNLCFSSQFAIGAVLSQSYHPICYAMLFEIKYSTIEKELLTVV